MTKLRIKGTQKQQTTNAVIEKQLFDKFRGETLLQEEKMNAVQLMDIKNLINSFRYCMRFTKDVYSFRQSSDPSVSMNSNSTSSFVEIKNPSWNLSNNTLTISGDQNIFNYDLEKYETNVRMDGSIVGLSEAGKKVTCGNLILTKINRYEDNQGSDSTHINLSFAVVLPE